MALRTVTKSGSGTFIYTSKMMNGETVAGFFMGTKLGMSKNPKWKPPLVLIFQKEDGQMLDVYTSGSLAYIEENAAKDPTQALITGQFTVITKTGSYKNKQGRDFPTFSVQQDDSKIVGVAGPITFQSPATAATVSAITADAATIQARLDRARQTSRA